MKFNKITTIALFSLSLFASYSYSAQSEDGSIATTECKSIGAFYIAEDQLIAQFFSCDNPASYNDLLVAMIRKETEYLNKLMAVQPNGLLSKKIHEIAQETHKHFSAVISVIKQYNGKSASKFVGDMNRVFDPEIAFATIANKLQLVLKDAEAAEETELVAVIQQLINILKKKKAEWVNKSKLTLLAGLTKRMSK